MQVITLQGHYLWNRFAIAYHIKSTIWHGIRCLIKYVCFQVFATILRNACKIVKIACV